jgi:beta-lactamase regulating signal transducer with metallopeptidase domain
VNSTLLFSWLLLITVKSVALLSGAGFVTLVLRRSSSSARHLVWLLAICGALCLPFSFVLPNWQVPLGLDRNAAYLPPAEDGSVLTQLRTDVLPVEDERTGELATQETARSTPWAAWAVWVWLTGVVFLLIRLVSGLALARVLVGRCSPDRGRLAALARQLQAGLVIKRPTSVLVGEREGMPAVPMTMGLLRPVILLPRGAEMWEEERLRATLLHELGHVRRGDFAWQVLAHFACALYWFNPLVWFAAGRLRVEGEQASDDLVISAGVSPADYAQLLLEAVRTMPDRSVRVETAAVAMARRSEIEVRISSLLSAGKRRGFLAPRIMVAAAVAATGLLVPLAALRPVARTSADEVTSAPRSGGRMNPVAVSQAPPSAVLQGGGAPAQDATKSPVQLVYSRQKERPPTLSAATPAEQLAPTPSQESAEVKRSPAELAGAVQIPNASDGERDPNLPRVVLPANLGSPAASPRPPRPARPARQAQ